jgi:hypothetical protein
MMTRKYGPIGTSIWDSEKFLALDGDDSRLAYLYLIACPHGNSLGVFRLPAAYLAVDRRTTAERAREMLADMVRVGLIETGPDDQIRIVSWFFHDTGAGNPSTASNFCKSFQDSRMAKPGGLRTRAMVEMIYATVRKAEAWNPGTTQFANMTRDIQNLLVAELKRDFDQTVEAMRGMEQPEPNTLLHTLLDTVSYTLGVDGVAHLVNTVGYIKKRETDMDRDMERETGDGEGDGEGEWSPEERGRGFGLPALPSESRQSGRKLPQDLKGIIDGMTAKAGPRRK